MRLLSQLALNDEGFVFDPTTGDSFQVSDTGLFILRCLREGKEEEEIAGMLAGEYEVTPDEAARDLGDFRGQLRALRLV